MRPIPALALVGVLLALVPAAQAVEYPFGTSVGSSDFDLSPLPSASSADLRYALCVIDLNGDGAATTEDHILLLTKTAVSGVCPASLQANPGSAILLNKVGGLQAGTEIKVTHEIAGSALSITGAAPGQFAHALRYYEDGTDSSKLDAKDALYLDLVGVASAIPSVGPGDLRISPVTTAAGTLPGGTLVKPGDADESRALSNIRAATAPATKLVSTTNMVYKAGSGYYLNADFGTIMGVSTCAALPCTPSVTGDVGVESGDVRLNPKAVNPLSDSATILPDHVEIVQAAVAPGQAFQVKVVAKNTGKAPGAGLIETRIGDDLVDARGTLTIPANGEATLVLTLVAPLVPGQYVVKSGAYADFLKVEGAAAGDLASVQGQVQQLEARMATLDAGDDRDTAAASLGAPGLGPTALVLALGLLAVALRRSA